MIRHVLVGLCAIALIGCQRERDVDLSADLPPTFPNDRMIQTNDVKLKVVDWGGTGPALMFLHGLGDNTHVFDDMAHRFSDRYHVYALDRRGHGGSELKPPFDTETLVTDLATVLDSLGIDTVSLVGHSMAGYEMIRFAARFPQRTSALVFLDAGYDYSDPTFMAAMAAYPVSYSPDSTTTRSAAAYLAWYHEVNWRGIKWTPAMMASARETFQVLSTGRVQPQFTDSLTGAFLDAIHTYRPQYDSVKAPVLAIFAHWPMSAMVKSDAPDSLKRKVADWMRDFARPIQEHALSRFRGGMPTARIIVLDSTNHYVMFARPDTVLAEMQAFLNPSSSMAQQ